MIASHPRASRPTARSTREVLPRTLAGILRDLGGIPAGRVRSLKLGRATLADVLRIDAHEDRMCELVDGVLVEKAMGLQADFLAAFLITLIKPFVDSKNLGLVLGSQATMQLVPGLIRIPDVSFIEWSRVGGKVPTEPVPVVSPNLAVEVLSPGNTKREMKRKCREYFESGTQLVWLVDPKRRTVAVHTGPGEFKILSGSDVLDGGSVLPGFSLKLKTLFAELDRTEKILKKIKRA